MIKSQTCPLMMHQFITLKIFIEHALTWSILLTIDLFKDIRKSLTFIFNLHARVDDKNQRPKASRIVE